MIDLGSSCYVTDHLSSYVQSRSYRAPEVILGLPYDQKIDVWSLGCILAELLSGMVVFQVCACIMQPCTFHCTFTSRGVQRGERSMCDSVCLPACILHSRCRFAW